MQAGRARRTAASTPTPKAHTRTHTHPTNLPQSKDPHHACPFRFRFIGNSENTMKGEVDEGGATVAAAAVSVESAAGPAKPMAKTGQNPLSRKLQRVLGGGGGGGGTVGPEVRTHPLSLSLSFALWLSRLDNASALGCSTTAQHSMDRLAVVSIVELLGRSVVGGSSRWWWLCRVAQRNPIHKSQIRFRCVLWTDAGPINRPRLRCPSR